MVRIRMPKFESFRVVPREAFNRHYYIAVFTFGLLGMARGLDEGVMSSQVLMPSFIRDYGVIPKSPEQSNITSMVQIGCVGGSILAFFTNDMLGRVRCCQITCLLWVIGAIIWMTSIGRLGQIYVGRLICGFGIGGTVVCGPTYLAEVTPKSMRGSLLGVGLFSASVYFGTLFGYGANLSAQRNMSPESRNQYLVPTSLNILFGGLFFVCSFFCLESPRWLAKKHRVDEAFANMQKLRQLPPDHPFLRQEWDAILDSIRTEEQSRGENWRWYNSIMALINSRLNMYILWCTVGAQVWGQFSGAGSITIYAPQLFEIVSGKPKTAKINPEYTIVLGAVKLVASLASSLFFLDRYGRKRVAMCGIVLQTISLLYIAIYLRIAPRDSPDTPGKRRGGEAAIAFLYLAGIAWAGGINCIQYILGAEYFSVVTRSLGMMISMAIHFACQFGSSRAVHPIMNAWEPWGLLLFWAMVSATSIFLVWFFLPESAGFSLEDMEELFKGPWYKIGWKHNRPYQDTGSSYSEQHSDKHSDLQAESPVKDIEDGTHQDARIAPDVTDGPATLQYSDTPQVKLSGGPVDDKKSDGGASGEDKKA